MAAKFVLRYIHLSYIIYVAGIAYLMPTFPYRIDLALGTAV